MKIGIKYVFIFGLLLLLSLVGNVWQYLNPPKCFEEVKTVVKSDTINILKYVKENYKWANGGSDRGTGNTGDFRPGATDTINAPIPEPEKRDSLNIYRGGHADSTGKSVNYETAVKGELVSQSISVVCPEKYQIINNTITTTKIKDRQLFVAGGLRASPGNIDFLAGGIFANKGTAVGYLYGIKERSHTLVVGIRLGK